MILDYFDRLYSSFRKLNKIDSMMRFLIRELTNFMIPFIFRFNRKERRLNKDDVIIVSFTSFPARINKVWLVIECLLRQTLLPSKICLWLAESQFPNKELDLPEKLKYYLERELVEIFFIDEDIRSHKKYYYAFNMFPKEIIITVDDDLFYASNVINDLVCLHKRHPNVLCCLRGYSVKKHNGKLLPYKTWQLLNIPSGPTNDIFHTSGGGTLYKRSFFSEEVLNKEVFTKICFQADDVWLNMMLQLNNTKSIRGQYYSHLLPIKNKSERLSKSNVDEGGNDKQIKAIVDYYSMNESILFSNN